MNEINKTNSNDFRQWFVVQTKPGNELRVEANLTNQAMEVLLPLYETFQHFNGKWIPRLKPLFPNYLFAKLDVDFHYHKVKWTRGVNQILGYGGMPIPVSGKVVEAIKSRMEDNNRVILDDHLEQGALVQFTSGPFKGLTGIFDKRMSDQRRVRVLLDLIGVDIPVQTWKWQIKKVA